MSKIKHKMIMYWEHNENGHYAHYPKKCKLDCKFCKPKLMLCSICKKKFFHIVVEKPPEKDNFLLGVHGQTCAIPFDIHICFGDYHQIIIGISGWGSIPWGFPFYFAKLKGAVKGFEFCFKSEMLYNYIYKKIKDFT